MKLFLLQTDEALAPPDMMPPDMSPPDMAPPDMAPPDMAPPDMPFVSLKKESKFS